MLNMPEQIHKLERAIYERAVQVEPTILIAVRHSGDCLWVTIRVNRNNQQFEQLAAWACKDLDRWHSQAGDGLVNVLSDDIIRMAKKIQLHNAG